MAPASLSVEGADAVLLVAEDGLPYLRGVAGLRLQAGSVCGADGRIAAIDDDPAAAVRFDASGCTVVPGLVDCHTHLPFAGWRAREYEMKVTGVPYEQIARSGGGIRASARALRESSDAQVLAQAGALAGEMLAAGTTTLETKSGYGLSRDGELRALRLAGELDVAQETVSTALLAHAVPDGFTAAGWMDEVEAMLPDVLARSQPAALDIFVESIAFTNDDLARMGELAREHGLALRAHVEQLSTHRSVPVALQAGARSVDHLSCLHLDDVEALARSECAAVLLPGAELLGAERVAPGRALADAGAICVLATDCNPGTSPIASLPLVIGLAVRRYGWSALEAVLAVTINAAYVISRSHDRGSIEVGKRADLVVLDGPLEHIPYRFGRNPVAAVFVAGEPAWLREDARWRLRG